MRKGTEFQKQIQNPKVFIPLKRSKRTALPLFLSQNFSPVFSLSPALHSLSLSLSPLKPIDRPLPRECALYLLKIDPFLSLSLLLGWKSVSQPSE